MVGYGIDDGAIRARRGDVYVNETCDQVRRRIKTFTKNGGIKVKEFINTLNVSAASYYRFMRQHGKNKGTGSDTFLNALLFFREREELGILMRKERNLGGQPPTRSPTNSTSRTAVLRLDGEIDNAVEVYDSCDKIRRKIKNHL